MGGDDMALRTVIRYLCYLIDLTSVNPIMPLQLLSNNPTPNNGVQRNYSTPVELISHHTKKTLNIIHPVRIGAPTRRVPQHPSPPSHLEITNPLYPV
jgi:hypothetical protein